MSNVLKRKIGLATVIIALLILVILYIQLSAEPPPETDAPATATRTRLFEREQGDLQRISFTSIAGEDFTVELAGDIWIYAEFPEIGLDQFAVQDVIRDILNLTAEDTLEITTPTDFGIGNIEITAHFSDGTETLKFGLFTPDRNRIYTMINDDPTMYLISSLVGERLSVNIYDLVATYLPFVNTMQLYYIYIQERDREALAFSFVGTDEELNDMLGQFGAVNLTMISPFYGRNLILSNFETNVLESLQHFEALEIVEFFPEPFDDPLLEIFLTDVDMGHFHLLFGDLHDDNHRYTMFADRPFVFLTDRHIAESLLNLNPFSLVERFVALINITEVERLTLESEARGNYEFHINHFSDDAGRPQIAPVLTGFDGELNDSEFRSFYQSVISLTFEHTVGIQEETESDLVITLHLFEGEPIILDFVAYDANFYLVRERPDPLQFVITRLAVNNIFNNLTSITD
ncbi:MAG: DUF4340 domain-containing protein [Turicibacter sp.]|nr:DUF4340 domain-containing protein [Turicibacter sp.]